MANFYKPLAHEVIVAKMLKAGVTPAKAKKVFEILFAKYGHFRSDGRQHAHDALKCIAYFI